MNDDERADCLPTQLLAQHSQTRQEIGRLLREEVVRRESRAKGRRFEHESEDRKLIRRNLGLIALRIHPENGIAGKMAICAGIYNPAESRTSYIQLPHEHDKRPAGSGWHILRQLIDNAGEIMALRLSNEGVPCDPVELYCDALRGTSMRKHLLHDERSVPEEFVKLQMDLADALVEDGRVVDLWQQLDVTPIHVRSFRSSSGSGSLGVVPEWLQNAGTLEHDLHFSQEAGLEEIPNELMYPSVHVGSKILAFDNRVFVLPKSTGERLLLEKELSQQSLSDLECLGWDPDLEEDGTVTRLGLPEVKYGSDLDYGWLAARYHAFIPVIMRATRNILNEPIVHLEFSWKRGALHVFPLLQGARSASVHASSRQAFLNVKPEIIKLALNPRQTSNLIFRDNYRDMKVDLAVFEEDKLGGNRVAIAGTAIDFGWLGTSEIHIPDEYFGGGSDALNWDKGLRAGAVYGYQERFIPNFEIRTKYQERKPTSIAEQVLANRPLEPDGIGQKFVDHVRKTADFGIELVQRVRPKQ